MNNEIKLPEFEVETVFSTMSEVIDWGLKQQHVPDTWKSTMGEGVTVYLLDTGCSDHIDLRENAICGGGFVPNEDENDNLSGHSTHVAGTIAASKNNMGVIGVAPKAKIVFLKCLGDSGNASAESVINALKYCIDIKDGKVDGMPAPDIISMSLGCPDSIPSIHYCIKELYKRDVPVVCAAGNQKSKVCYPAKYPETISVAAYDQNKNIADFNNFGPEIDFAAPGVGIYSTYLNNKYAKMTGSSMAAPFISGTIALMLSKHRKQEEETGQNDCKTVKQIKEHLIKYSIDMGKEGKDNKFGYGIIDVTGLIDHDKTISQNTKKEKGFFKKLKEYLSRFL